MTGPLAGVKVLDLTSVVSGPHAAMILCDQGADVIKVKAPEGDILRRGTMTPGFVSSNRGKRFIIPDSRRPDARAVLRKLIAVSDVLVQNFRPGVAERLGFGEPAVLWPEGLGDLTLVDAADPGARPASAPDLIFKTLDGYITAGALSDAEWRGMCTVLNRPELIDDPRFRTGAGRSANAAERIALVGGVFATGYSADWLARLDAAQVPCAPVLTRRELLSDPQIAANGRIVEFDQPALGRVRQARPAARFDRTPSRAPGPAPVLGEPTQAVLRELGLS